MLHRHGLLGLLATVVLVTGGCAADADGPTPSAATPGGATTSSSPSASAYDVVPVPGRTVDAGPVQGGEELAGYRLAVVVPDDSAASGRLLAATRTFAEERGADLQVVEAQPGADPVGAALADALATQPDLVVGLGEGVADVFGFETAQRLEQQFLVVGAQVAEPTANVTAVIWDGATGRGSGVAPDGELDPAGVTEQRGAEALGVGVASVRQGETGIVLRLPSQD